MLVYNSAMSMLYDCFFCTRDMPFFGIYVLMFFDILKTVVKLGLILLVFLIAFGLGFNLLLVRHVSRASVRFSNGVESNDFCYTSIYLN